MIFVYAFALIGALDVVAWVYHSLMKPRRN